MGYHGAAFHAGRADVLATRSEIGTVGERPQRGRSAKGRVEIGGDALRGSKRGRERRLAQVSAGERARVHSMEGRRAGEQESVIVRGLYWTVSDAVPLIIPRIAVIVTGAAPAEIPVATPWLPPALLTSAVAGALESHVQ